MAIFLLNHNATMNLTKLPVIPGYHLTEEVTCKPHFRLCLLPLVSQVFVDLVTIKIIPLDNSA